MGTLKGAIPKKQAKNKQQADLSTHTHSLTHSLTLSLSLTRHTHFLSLTHTHTHRLIQTISQVRLARRAHLRAWLNQVKPDQRSHPALNSLNPASNAPVIELHLACCVASTKPSLSHVALFGQTGLKKRHHTHQHTHNFRSSALTISVLAPRAAKSKLPKFKIA